MEQAATGDEATLQISVVMITGEALSIDAAPTDTIKCIKEKVQAARSTPAVSLQLALGSELLGDERTLLQCGIGHGSTLTLVVEPSITLHVMAFDYNYEYQGVTLEVAQSGSIADVMEKVNNCTQRVFEEPLHCGVLFLHGKCLRDVDAKLVDCGIRDNCVLLGCAKEEWMPLFVRYIQHVNQLVHFLRFNREGLACGVAIVMALPGATTIRELRKVLTNRGNPIDDITFDGQGLDEDKSLEEYGIRECSVLFTRSQSQVGPQKRTPIFHDWYFDWHVEKAPLPST